MMQEGGLDCVTGLGKYQGRLIILLDIDKVLAARELADESPAENRRRPAWQSGAKAADRNSNNRKERLGREVGGRTDPT